MAQVPPSYHVPPEIKQPIESAFRYPLPLMVPVLVEVGDVAVLVDVVPVRVDVARVVVGTAVPDVLGRYLTPLEGQLELVPAGAAAMNSPLATEPLTR